jgi:hypothetical protein
MRPNIFKHLAVAKLIYLEGLKYSKNDNRINNKLAILNFDLSVTNLIIASCYEKRKDTRRKKSGKVKDFPELIENLQKIYDNSDLIHRINDLHDLRNSVQHGANNPSKWDIQRFNVTVREFFDDVCIKVFTNISFESISFSKLLKSPHEQQLMELIEDYIGQEKFSLVFNLIIICLLYRYQLIITRGHPFIPVKFFYFFVMLLSIY